MKKQQNKLTEDTHVRAIPHGSFGSFPRDGRGKPACGAFDFQIVNLKFEFFQWRFGARLGRPLQPPRSLFAHALFSRLRPQPDVFWHPLSRSVAKFLRWKQLPTPHPEKGSKGPLFSTNCVNLNCQGAWWVPRCRWAGARENSLLNRWVGHRMGWVPWPGMPPLT